MSTIQCQSNEEMTNEISTPVEKDESSSSMAASSSSKATVSIPTDERPSGKEVMSLQKASSSEQGKKVQLTKKQEIIPQSFPTRVRDPNIDYSLELQRKRFFRKPVPHSGGLTEIINISPPENNANYGRPSERDLEVDEFFRMLDMKISRSTGIHNYANEKEPRFSWIHRWLAFEQPEEGYESFSESSSGSNSGRSSESSSHVFGDDSDLGNVAAVADVVDVANMDDVADDVADVAAVAADVANMDDVADDVAAVVADVADVANMDDVADVADDVDAGEIDNGEMLSTFSSFLSESDCSLDLEEI